MHFVFILYGKRDCVELLLREMEAQKHLMILKKEGCKDVPMWVNSQIRQLPFGVYEYIFCKEDLDMVLHTMLDNLPATNDRYGLGYMKLALIRKMLDLEKIPIDYKKNRKYLWIKKDVTIIPLGLREDADFIEPKGMPYEGYHHEAF